MTTQTYLVGNSVTIRVSFLNSSKTLANPTTTTFYVKHPSGAQTTHVYSTDPNVVRDSTGKFHFDLLLTRPGNYFWRWEGVGNVDAATEGVIQVTASQVK